MKYAPVNYAMPGLQVCLTEADSLFSCYARGDYARHITYYRSFLLVAG